MGYFDGITDAVFKTAEDGTSLFYPNGVLGKGYILPDAAKKQEIRKKLKVFYIIFLPTIILINPLFCWFVFSNQVPWWAALLIFLVYLCGGTSITYFIMHRWVKGLMPAAEKLTLAEAYKNSARSNNIVVLWILEIMAIIFLLMTVIGLLKMISDYSAIFRSGYPLGAIMLIIVMISIPLWGGCAYVFGYMIHMKRLGGVPQPHKMKLEKYQNRNK